MRKASARFAKGKLQEAHDLYGDAAARYGEAAEGLEALRAALALYTRAMFVIAGDAIGDADEDVRRGSALVAKRDDAEGRRFRGLFLMQAAVLNARANRVGRDEIRSSFGEARGLLAESGLALDQVEVERAAAAAWSRRGEHAWAREAAEAAVVAAGDDTALLVHARRTLADVHEAAGQIKEAIDALSSAFQSAAGRAFYSTRTELDDRITALKRKLDAGD